MILTLQYLIGRESVSTDRIFFTVNLVFVWFVPSSEQKTTSTLVIRSLKHHRGERLQRIRLVATVTNML